MGLWGRKLLEQRISAQIPRLYVIAKSWGCPAAFCDDLVQDTVANALNKLEQLRSPEALEVWLIQILTNCHRQHLRKQSYLTHLEDDLLIEEQTPAGKLESDGTVNAVRAAISCLSDEHRKVVTLVDMEGLSYREVADVLEIRIGTVMSRLCRARNRLRELLAGTLEQEMDRKKEAPAKLWRVK